MNNYYTSIGALCQRVAKEVGMGEILGNLEPKRVFHYFEEMCAIPHGSGNTKGISDYLVGVAKKLGLKYVQDASNNVIIYKPASKGCEDKPTVIMQGHMDMIAENDPDVPFDWSKDGLKLRVEGDFVRATGTTLGGDDGVAEAIALAILEDDTLVHPPLEALFTVDEEIGLLGADALDASVLKGRMLLNMDSEGEGVFLAGCAGGGCATFTAPMDFDTIDIEAEGYKKAVVAVTKLRGGHSGAEIHHQRANANVVLARVIDDLHEKGLVRVIAMQGGSKDNAIPYMATANVLVKESAVAETRAVVTDLEDKLRTEFGAVDPELTLVFELGDKLGSNANKAVAPTITRGTAPGLVRNVPVGRPNVVEPTWIRVLTKDATHKAVGAILGFPNGIIAYNRFIHGLVETSLNLGILTLSDEGLKMVYSVRSGSTFEKEALLRRLSLLADSMELTMKLEGSYPPWQYRSESALRETMVEVYRKMFGETPSVETIHAGVECGILSEKMPGLDAVSFGPNLYDIHTTTERMSISSLERTYRFVRGILEELAK